ncbi:MAG: exosortase/archaeosortase family protein [Candidatus Zixiibacteriota bacterium]
MNGQIKQIIRDKYFIILGIVLLLAYFPTLIDLVSDWYNDANYSHSFLIPLISGYLIWQKRKSLEQIELSSNGFGLFLIILGLGFFIIGNGASEYFTVRFSLVVTITGIILYHFGSRFFKNIWFALFFLLFMIPIPYVIYFSATFPMQIFASKVTVHLLDIIGMAAVRQGNIIHLSNQSLEVAEACSGMRSLVSLLALGALFAYFHQKRFSAQLILFLSTIPIAVVANVFRVFVTSVIVYTSPDLRVTDEPLHSIMGASVFVIAFILLLIFGAILRKIFK